MLKNEIIRKTIHISSITIPLAYRYVLNYNKFPLIITLGVITLFAIAIEYFRFERRNIGLLFSEIFGFLIREHENKDLTGATYLLTSSVFCIAVFPADIAFCALCFLAIGDTAAALVGGKFGKRKIYKTAKSLEGSIACFVVCFVFAILFLDSLDVTFYSRVLIAFFGAFAATIAESYRIYLDDNVKIPLFSSTVMSITYLFSF